MTKKKKILTKLQQKQVDRAKMQFAVLSGAIEETLQRLQRAEIIKTVFERIRYPQARAISLKSILHKHFGIIGVRSDWLIKELFIKRAKTIIDEDNAVMEKWSQEYETLDENNAEAEENERYLYVGTRPRTEHSPRELTRETKRDEFEDTPPGFYQWREENPILSNLSRGRR